MLQQLSGGGKILYMTPNRSVGSLSVADVKRFRSKITKLPGPKACWIWSGGIHKKSKYGHFWLNNRTLIAHNVAWIIRHGAIPKWLYVMHKCNNRACVRLSHLKLGTHKQNMEYMKKCG